MRIFLFGEAEKGEFCTPFRLQSVLELSERFGNPPKDSIGVDYAIQSLLYDRELIFFRVREEGFSLEDYMRGVKLLYNHGDKMKISAVCMPGMGDMRIMEEIAPICMKLGIILILSEKDLYDYLTGSKY